SLVTFHSKESAARSAASTPAPLFANCSLYLLFVKAFFCRPSVRRQMDFKGRSDARLALDFDRAAVILDDTLADRQSQSQSPAFLGTIERLKDLVDFCCFDADSAVSHREHHLAGAGVELGPDRERAPVRHGVDGVQK